MSATSQPPLPDHPGEGDDPPEAETVAGELAENPALRRTIEVLVQQNVQQNLHLREREMLPDPAELARFDEVVPGLAAQVAQEWRTEADARRRLDERVTDAQIAGYRRYQWFAFIVLLALIGAGVFLFSIDKDGYAFVALILGSCGVLGQLLAPLFRRPRDDQEDD